MPLVTPNAQDSPTFQAQAVVDKTDLAAIANAAKGYGVISGCLVSPGGGYLVNVASGTVQVSGTQVAVAAATGLSLFAANATDRRDIVVASNVGAVSIVSGTPTSETIIPWAATSLFDPPVKPAIPPNSVMLGEIYIPGGGGTIVAGWLTDKTLITSVGVLTSGVIYATGLVNDGGVTDNTAALAAAAALLPAASGTLMLPSGKFGCNWTPPTGINLTGQGNGNPSSSGSTILCGVNSLTGNQIAPIQRTNANITLTNLTIDGGGATDTSYAPLQSYSCLFACYDNSVDTNTFDTFFLGGTITSWFQDTGCGRPNSSLVRCTNNYGGATNLAAHGKLQRTITGNGTTIGITTNSTVTITTDAGHPFILPTLAGGTMGGDVGRAIVAVGLSLGTYITAVATTTSATINQPATASASFITATFYQGEAAFLAGTDNQILELRSTNGTTRLAGGGGNQIAVGHFTLTGSSGTMPPNTTFESGMWTISTLYSDSSAPNSANIVHTVGAKQCFINNLVAFQNAPNANAFIVENDTVNSMSISGGGLSNKNVSALNFTTFLNLAGGSNSSFTCDGPFWASNQSLDKTGGVPNLVTGGTPGRMVFNYSVTGSGPGTLFSISPVQAGSGLVAGAKLYSGVGAPNIPESLSGDFYFRTGTPATANQRLYIATAVNTWTGIV